MRILQINKFYHIFGGVDRYFLELSKLLSRKGHTVVPFSMQHPFNEKTQWNKYFVPYCSFETVSLSDGFQRLTQMVYNIEARRRFSALLNRFPADIAHVHQIYHQISPSILFELKKRRIPIVHTVGDYHLISPHHNNLYHNGRICEITKVNKYYKSVLHKCIKDSYLASFAEAVEQYIHHWFGYYRNTIDFYIAPSQFLKNKLVQYKIPESKIFVLPYFIDTSNYQQRKYDKGQYILYFGRLSPEKGLRFLLEVVNKTKNITYMIVGKGVEGDYLIDRVKEMKLKNIKVINHFIPEQELLELIKGSKFIIYPSQSLEIFGISILESFALCKPVIASNIGALPEVVQHGSTGLLFDPGNVASCANAIRNLWSDTKLRLKMNYNARHFIKKNFTPEIHYKKIISLYRNVIHENRIKK